MKKKKIVYIAQAAGGVAEYLYMFLNNYRDNNLEQYLIVSSDYESNIERFDSLVDKIYVVDMVREINLKKDLKSICEIKKILRKIKPNIVYMHSSKAGGLGRLALLFSRKIKKIYNAHGWYFNAQISNKKKKMYQLIEKMLAYNTDVIINISKQEHESALKNKIAPKNKMILIENGIDFTKFNEVNKFRNEMRNKYLINNNEIVIGVVGRLSEQKDPITMTKAFIKVNKIYKNTKLFFVGSGDLEEEIKEIARKNDIENNLIITGWVKNVEKYIPAFDIAILPSKWEGFGLAIVEYMACDKPIIASNVGGIADIIENEKSGLLIEAGNSEELAKKVISLIENKELANKIIETNKKYREKYDIKTLVEQHKNVLKVQT